MFFSSLDRCLLAAYLLSDVGGTMENDISTVSGLLELV